MVSSWRPCSRPRRRSPPPSGGSPSGEERWRRRSTRTFPSRNSPGTASGFCFRVSGLAVARSTRYRALLPRLSELRGHLLPAKFDPTSPYSDRQYDRVRGYRLLAHAEIEACIEDLVRDTVIAAWTGWSTDARPRTCLMALVAYYEGDLG